MANYARRVFKVISIPSTSSNEFEQSITYNGKTDYPLTEYPRNPRTAPTQFSIGSTVYITAANLVRALQYDYTPGGLVTSNPIAVGLINAGDEFAIQAYEYGFTFEAYTLPSWLIITEDIPEVLPALDFDILSQTLQEADGADKCNYVRYNITLENYDSSDFPVVFKYGNAVIKTAVDESDLYFDYLRYPVPTQFLTATSNNGPVSNNFILLTVSTFQFQDTGIAIEETFTGATVTLTPSIVNVGDTSLSFTYSLDDSNYQLSNVFYGLTPDTYTAYILDQYGCKKSQEFVVIGVTVDKPEPYFNISNANSIKYYKDIEFDYKTTFPNFDNSLVIDQDIFNTEKSCYQQLFQTNDTIVTQIQSNYDNISISVIDDNYGDVISTPTPIEKKTNILQLDKRDCKIIGGDSGKTLIYFPSGDIYTPNTLDVIGDYINPNLLLPEFLDAGTLQSGVKITLSGNSVLNGSFDVEGEIYSNTINGRALQINAFYTGTSEGTDAIVQSIYNALDYNIWEFTIDFDSFEYGEGNYHIEIEASDSDPRYNTVNWLSEHINVRIRQEKTVYIEYSNSENYAFMDYSTGIVNMLRIPARFALYNDSGDRESFQTSTGKIEILKKINVRDVTLQSSFIPQYIAEKISLASGHDVLKINGIACAQNESGEIESNFDEQNRLYTYTGVFRFDVTTITGNTTGLVSESGDVLGAGAGIFVLGIG